jgi:hypothetical protein
MIVLEIKMEQIGPDLYAYKAEPIGEDTWMQQKEYIIRNCVKQRTTLKKIVLLAQSHLLMVS